MNMEALFLFLILLLGLVLSSFLGGNSYYEGHENHNDNKDSTSDPSSNSQSSSSSSYSSNYDNYNHYSGSSSDLQNGAIYYGANGGTVVVTPGRDGTQTLIIKVNANSDAFEFSPHNSSGKISKFYGPNGNTATVVNSDGSNKAIRVSTSNGNFTFTQNGAFYNPDGTTSTQYFGSTGTPIQSSGYSLAYEGHSDYAQGPYGGSAASVTGPQGNTAYYAQGPMGNAVAGGSYGPEYASTLPPGIPRSQIPPGQEDLYILKSEIVPPICPVCPVAQATAPREEKCPPCPAPARCPEPAMTCKAVPNYNAIDDQYLPQPVLSDFSSFGM